jgi:hypothetical protein
MRETRRTALKRFGLALLGLGGLAASTGGWRSVAAPQGEALASRQPPPVEMLTFRGRGWHIASRDVLKGKLPEGGERMLAYGELYEAGSEVKAGDFAATYFGLPQPAAGGRLASLEQHVFNLPGGSIHGSGMTKPGLATEDEFAIVGGTGVYAGARGTYTLRQDHLEFGGDGTAEITFRLMSEAAS